MCEICNGSGRNHLCPVCLQETIEQECDCIEGVYFFIREHPASEEEYNNHPIESEKRFELCNKCE